MKRTMVGLVIAAALVGGCSSGGTGASSNVKAGCRLIRTAGPSEDAYAPLLAEAGEDVRGDPKLMSELNKVQTDVYADQAASRRHSRPSDPDASEVLAAAERADAKRNNDLQTFLDDCP